MDAHEDMDKYLNLILDKLKSLDIYKVILFGSHAQGNTHEESDFDLLVVLNDTSLPHNYKERMDTQLSVSRVLRDIHKEVPIDLLVFTIPEYEIIMNNMNSFFRDIHENGKVVYEKAS